MLMFLRLIIVLALFYPTLSFSQKVQGRILNEDGNGLANVALKIDANNISKLAVSDKNGYFAFADSLKRGMFRLNARLIGYNHLDTILSYPLLDPLILVMRLNVINLKGVTVSASRNQISIKPDRLIFSLENDPNFSGNNGLEVLSKIPLVSVDRGSVKIVGKSSGAGIMVDGKLMKMDSQSTSQYLSTLNAANISKIEVITQPSAEYDASASGGLINVITKQIKQPGLFATLITNYTRTSFNGINQSISINYNLKKLLLYGSFGYSNGASANKSIEERILRESRLVGSQNGKTESNWVRGNLALEYPLSKQNTIGASLNWLDSRPDVKLVLIQNLSNISNGMIDSNLSVVDQNDIHFRNFIVNIHFNRNMNKSGSKFTSDFDYFSSDFDNIHESINSVFDKNGAPKPIKDNFYQSGRILHTNGMAWSTDFIVPTKNVVYNFGGKISGMKNRNLSLLAIGEHGSDLKNISNDDFRFTEITEALYATASGELGELQIKLGLRAEASQTNGISHTTGLTHRNDYISLFPSAYFTYPASKSNSISLSYSRKIGRPNFSLLNPGKIYSNRNDYTTGNPYLNPYFTHSFQLINSYKSKVITYLSFEMYRDRADGIQIYDKDSNLSTSFFGNFLSNRTLYLDNTYLLKSTSWMQHSLGFGISYNWNRSYAPQALIINSGFGGDFRAINTLNFNKAKTFNGGVTFRYNFPTPSGLSTFKQYYSVDISSNAQVFKKKATISATLMDMFNTKNIPVNYMVNGIVSRREFNNDTRRFTLSFVYNYGNTKISKARSYNGSSSEQARGSL